MGIENAEIIVVKVGTSTLTYENGKLNLKRIEMLCRTLSDLQNSGKKIVLVSSGAIGVGVGKLGLSSKPNETSKKQAAAAVGQCELMFIYDKFFSEYNQTVAQILLTGDVVLNENKLQNVQNTFRELLAMNVIPIVNENDTVETAELEGSNIGDNDTLSAIVACCIDAHVLIILSDIDGLFDSNPKENPNAKIINTVENITPEILQIAGGAGSNRGTGGMITKIKAAKLTTEKGIFCAIANGNDTENIYKILNGVTIGTVFKPNKI